MGKSQGNRLGVKNVFSGILNLFDVYDKKLPDNTLSTAYVSTILSTSRTYTFLEFIVVGGGGGGTGVGGQGGFVIARFNVPTTTSLVYGIGGAGTGPGSTGAGGAVSAPVAYGKGGSGLSELGSQYTASGGGALSGVFLTPSIPGISNPTALVISGGGGGIGLNGVSGGGNGGGSSGDAGLPTGTGGVGGGGTQSAGGTAGANQPGNPAPLVLTATAGSTGLGGNNGAALSPTSPFNVYAGGGGGAGYYGGGGGGASNTTGGTNSGHGGGGSGYVNTTSPYFISTILSYTGMGAPGGSGVGGPYPLGAGKDHPQILGYWAQPNTQYGNSGTPGIIIVNEYKNGFP